MGLGQAAPGPISKASMNWGISKRGLQVAAGNVLLALMYATFAYAHLQSFAKTPRLSLLLAFLVETLTLIFGLVRKDSNGTWHSSKTWVTTLGGTFAPLLFWPTAAPVDLFAGQLIQLAGFTLQVGALLSLNRSFGLLPAHRDVKSGGLYRWIRHPLYSAYTLANIGYMVNNLSLYNVAIFVVATGFQVLRVINEETFLSRYGEYSAYAKRTRWRLIPLIW
ncbi:MAG: methyltransferase family protein [Kiloniellaceae bacterium]